VQEVLLSFTSTSLLSPRDRVPVGFENYQDLASQSDFLAALATTAIYTVACVVLVAWPTSRLISPTEAVSSVAAAATARWPRST